MKKKVSLFWFRRDLRIDDNAGLYHALKSKYPVIPVFIFDSNILDKLENKSDARVQFIHNALNELNQSIKSYDSALQVYHGDPIVIWKKLLHEHNIVTVFTNHDFESYALERESILKPIRIMCLWKLVRCSRMMDCPIQYLLLTKENGLLK